MEPIPETRQAFHDLGEYGESDVAVAMAIMSRRLTALVPQVVGLSVTLIEEGLTFTMVATDLQTARLDAIQYLDGGPCIEAAQTGERLGWKDTDPTDERLWHMFAQAKAAHGIAATLSLPFTREGSTLSGFNIYASAPDAFDGRWDAVAAILGAQATDLISNADLGFSTRLEAMKAPRLLRDQEDLDIAVGLIAQSQTVDVGTAKERLRQAAARAGITEPEAARAVIALLDLHPE